MVATAHQRNTQTQRIFFFPVGFIRSAVRARIFSETRTYMS